MFDYLLNGTKKVNKMSDEEREIVRLSRDKNLLEMEIKNLKKTNGNLTTENEYLKKRNKILETIEVNFRMRVDKYKNVTDKPAAYDDFKAILDEIDYEEKRIEHEKKNIAF